MSVSIPSHTSRPDRSLDQRGSGLREGFLDRTASDQQRRAEAAQAAKVREKAAAVIASASGQVPGTLGR